MSFPPRKTYTQTLDDRAKGFETRSQSLAAQQGDAKKQDPHEHEVAPDRGLAPFATSGQPMASGHFSPSPERLDAARDHYLQRRAGAQDTLECAENQYLLARGLKQNVDADEKRKQIGLVMLLRSAKLGNILALNELADSYRRGVGTPVDPNVAKEMAESFKDKKINQKRLGELLDRVGRLEQQEVKEVRDSSSSFLEDSSSSSRLAGVLARWKSERSGFTESLPK